MQPPTINGSVSALRFFFTVTLDRPDLSRAPGPGPLSAQAASGAERRGSRPAARSGTGHQVQGRTRHRLWRGPARVGGGQPQGRRHRQHAHADPRRAGQGTQGPQRHAVAPAAGAAAAVVAEGKRRGVMLPHGWLFPGRSCTDPISTRQINRAVQEAAEVAGIRKRVSPTRCATASPPTCWSRMSTSASSRCCSGTASSIPPRSTPRVATKTIRVGDQSARASGGADGGRGSRRLNRLAHLARGRRYLPRCRPGYRAAHAGHLSLTPAQGHVGDRDTAAPRRLAVTSRPARTAGIGASPTTAAATGTAPSARAPPRAPGWPSAKPTCCRSATSTSSSRCPPRSPTSPSRTRRWSTTCCSRRHRRRC